MLARPEYARFHTFNIVVENQVVASIEYIGMLCPNCWEAKKMTAYIQPSHRVLPCELWLL